MWHFCVEGGSVDLRAAGEGGHCGSAVSLPSPLAPGTKSSVYIQPGAASRPSGPSGLSFIRPGIACGSPALFVTTMASAAGKTTEPQPQAESCTQTLVEIETSCSVAEFNGADGQLRAEGGALIAFTRVAVPSRPGATLRLNNVDAGPIGQLEGKVLPEPGFEESWCIPSRTGTKRPEPYKAARPTDSVHGILKAGGFAVPGGYISAMNYDKMRIEGADPDERVEIRGINIRREMHGMRFWVFA